MAGITLAIAQEKLDQWLAADEAVAKAQEYEIAGRKMTKANAKQIRENIDYWAEKVRQLSGTGRRFFTGVRR
ncbi:DUF6148 family protein [Mesoterricola silvestris]|uniref:Uncharacterized protein n=1 Tax=Mesoterricola silvestris TaxID=2927979 RepID=A0AA48GRY7_9BACT|nr:DUF6148 family protein [Mesoterricola silvestris]BDU72917.1 hypothetical protein METEAL_20910 [Mesoterricola silvestris]